MPFDLTHGVVYGDDAKTPLKWARETFCEWLAAKLNDPGGPYAAALGVTAERPAFVLENAAIAQAMYRRADAPPVVSVSQGPVNSMDWRKDIDGVERNGRRIEIECTLGMGVADRTPDDDDVAAERSDDNNLAGFVCDIIGDQWEDLETIGLFNAAIDPDPEAGVKHPQKLTFFIRTLRDWTPTP
ncbi:MAG: hypothetical protein KY445_04710 [Armatimonadetes bacterium]|nr:hypothetical protein [Armatimonadota bacterium]